MSENRMWLGIAIVAGAVTIALGALAYLQGEHARSGVIECVKAGRSPDECYRAFNASTAN